MSNMFSLKNNIANSLKDTNKKKSHSKFVSSSGILENNDFKKFLELYLSNETEFFERIDGYDGFISTQQIESVDYDNFAEHVFFDSAVEKVNYAFDKVINDFPYDSSNHKISQYLKKLDGFTRFVLKEKVEKQLNYLRFTGNEVVVIEDKKGHLLNDFTGNNFSNSFNPNTKAFSFDFWFLPLNENNQSIKTVLFKKYVNENGFLITVDYQEDSDECNLSFYVIEGDNSFKLTYTLKMNEFQHVFFEVYNETLEDEIIKEYRLFINGKEVSKKFLSENNKISGDISSLLLKFEDSSFIDEKVYIGGSDTQNISTSINDEPILQITGRFEGLIDEFKFFTGEKRKYENILKFKDENENANSNLTLCLRFNERSGVYPNNFIVLDYSGNKLHGLIKSIDSNFGITSLDNSFERNGLYNNYSIPLKYESLEKNPLLFSFFSQNKKESMMKEAIEYDLINPNSFWKLLPKNLFLEGSDYDNINEVYINPNTKPNNNILGTEKSINQEIIKLISIWARFFDQIKMYIDNFTELLNFSYDTINKGKKIDGMILPLALNQAGFKFREILALPVLEKLERKNLTHEEVLSVFNVRQIQNILWKRFLLNSKDYLMSKGTKKSIRSVFNSFGLEANKYISIKEANGQNRFNVSKQFIENRQKIKFLDFNKHKKIFEQTNFNNTVNTVSTNKITFLTQDLNKQNFDFEDDWALEFYFKYDKSKIKMFDLNQSLFRIDRFTNDDVNAVPFINLVFKRIKNENEFGEIDFYVNLENHEDSVINGSISNINLLNGCVYHTCLRKRKNRVTNLYEYILDINPTGSLSYVYNKQITLTTGANVIDDNNNTFKYRLAIGEFKYQSEALNNFDYTTIFQGLVTQIRMYTDFLENEVLFIKSKDIKYVSSKNKSIDLNSLKLNIDLTENLNKVIGNSGEIELFNYITDVNKMSAKIDIGTALYAAISADDTKIENFFSVDDHSILIQNPEIDVPSNSNKVYINSFEGEYYKEQYKNKNLSHSSQHHPEYLYHDDQRLYIDFSVVNFLNKDMTKIIAVNDYFTNLLSKSSYLYDENYLDLIKARDDYFKRIKSKEGFNIDILYQVYKYFDNILEDLLHDGIPSRVNYLGFNFVYESHILERNKYQYKMSDSRMPIVSEDAVYQNYTENTENLVKYRKDNSVDFFENSIIKKKETI